MSSNIFSETCGAFSTVKLYKCTDNDDSKVIVEIKSADYIGDHEQGTECTNSISQWIQRTKFTFRQVFLPSGYPNSVSKDYITYQIWDTVQAFASSITGALATEAVLKGVGVGDEKATALAAALTWIIKNGSGMIGNIIFAWAKGTSLDHECKKWRLFADVLNDFAFFVDLITPLFPSRMVVFVLCCSSVFRSLVGVAGGATRAAITQHQARNNNMADVSAKDGSQETLVNLMALVASLIILPLVSGKPFYVWGLFFLFTAIHLFANYRAVKSLAMETLNLQRLLICSNHYLNYKQVPSIQSVNSEESVIIGRGLKDTHVCDFKIRLGVPLDEALGKEKLTKSVLNNLVDKTDGKSFIIIPKFQQKQINVILQENINPSEILEAYFRSIAVASVDSSRFLLSGDLKDAMDPEITKMWMEFRRIVIAKGFDVDRALIETGDWRAKWKQ